MLSRSHVGATDVAMPSYQVTAGNGSAPAPQQLGLMAPATDNHRCPGMLQGGVLVPCTGTLQLVKVAQAQLSWLGTPGVLACSRCTTRLAVLLTFQRRFTNVLQARFSGPCRHCKRTLIITDEAPPVAEYRTKRDPRFFQAAHHKVPACDAFAVEDLVDVCLAHMGVGPTAVVRS